MVITFDFFPRLSTKLQFVEAALCFTDPKGFDCCDWPPIKSADSDPLFLAHGADFSEAHRIKFFFGHLGCNGSLGSFLFLNAPHSLICFLQLPYITETFRIRAKSEFRLVLCIFTTIKHI